MAVPRKWWLKPGAPRWGTHSRFQSHCCSSGSPCPLQIHQHLEVLRVQAWTLAPRHGETWVVAQIPAGKPDQNGAGYVCSAAFAHWFGSYFRSQWGSRNPAAPGPARAADGRALPGLQCPPQCRMPSSCQRRSPTPTTSPGLALMWGRRSCVAPVLGYLKNTPQWTELLNSKLY